MNLMTPLFAVLVAGLSLASVASWADDLPVLPGLNGFGVGTPAGRGGRLIRVTNLDSWGEGSLAYALWQSGPRTIIFDVSGTIWQQDDIVIREPYVTVAFQTAPAPGITVAGAGIEIRTHDVLLHHARVRVGDLPGDPYPGNRDGISVNTGSYNVVIDHCSVSWAVDENTSASGTGLIGQEDNIHDVTFSNCLIAEALQQSIHPEGAHSKGMLIHDYSQRVAIVRNIFAHGASRSPSLKAATSAFVANNLIYNPLDWGTGISEGHDTGPQQASIIGNHYRLGPDSWPTMSAISVFDEVSAQSEIYLRDNYASHQNDPDYRAWLRENSPLTPDTGDWSLVRIETPFVPRVDSPPLAVDGFVPLSSADVPDVLLVSAGARPSDRDSVDARILAEIRAGTGRIIDSQAEVGGWPDLARNTRVSEIPDDPHGDEDGDGYTNLEEWLHAAAADIEDAGLCAPRAYSDHEVELQNLYIAYFGRPADPLGLVHWKRELAANGGDLGPIAESFSRSEEYLLTYRNLTEGELVVKVYRQLFDRTPEQAGYDYWLDALQRGAVPVSAMVIAVLHGALGDDRRIMDNKNLAARHITSYLENHADNWPQHWGSALLQVAADIASAHAVCASF